MAGAARSNVAKVGLVTGLVAIVLFLLYSVSESNLKADSLMMDSQPVTKDATLTLPTFKHLLIFIADDFGYLDVSDDDTHRYQQATPNIDKYMYSGIRLTKHYTLHVCTPARAALLTGKYPIHTGMASDLIQLTSEYSLPLSHTLLSEYLSASQFSTHLIGKWHLGHYSRDSMPQRRGFDSFFGLLTGTSYYTTHKHSIEYRGVYWHDLIESTLDVASGEETMTTRKDLQGTYSTHLYVDKADEIIESFAAGEYEKERMFMMVSIQNPHGPLEEPPSNVFSDSLEEGLLSTISDPKEKIYVKSVAWMDHAFNQVMTSLEESDMMDDTLVVFLSDNGGCHYTGGYNFPLRGGKGSLFEGGVRTNAFIYSNKLKSAAGSLYSDYFHVTDWLPTVTEALSLSADQLTNLDGLSHYSKMFDTELASGNAVRNEILLNIDNDGGATGGDDDDDDHSPRGLIMGNYKLIFEYPQPVYYPDGSDDADDDLSDSQDCKAGYMVANSTDNTFKKFLFDLNADPYESKNLLDDEYATDEYLNIAMNMETKLEEYAATSASSCYTAFERVGDTIADVWKAEGRCIVPWYESLDEEEQQRIKMDSCGQ